MKNLTLSTAKVFKLSLVFVALASTPVFAGGNDDKIEIKKSEANSYALALSDMEKALDEAEEIENIYSPAPQIKIYDSNFNLVKEADIPEDGIVEDKELLKLMRQSNELMKFENITYLILNN